MPMRVGFLSTYPPTQCGLATFTAALRRHLAAAGHDARVVRVLDAPQTTNASPEVSCDLVNSSATSVRTAGEALNRFDVVIVQHEYGIYGGLDGEELLPLLDIVNAPIIVVLHTVLAHPTARQRHVLERVVDVADAVVTMTETARTRLLVTYGVGADRVSVIPHGAADNRVRSIRSPIGRRPKLLTWGLLGPGKGLEHAIEAVAILRRHGRDVRYLIAGQTHPKVLRRDGESYRQSLMACAQAGGVADLVDFDNRFLETMSLNRLIADAEIVVLPYDSDEQVTSGVLIEAVTAGKPVVSTAFPHAIELLGSGAGMVVPRRDPQGLADALLSVLSRPGLAAAMARESTRLAPKLLWPAVAQSYGALVATVLAAREEALA